MMKMRIFKWLPLLMLFLLAACRSSQSVVENPAAGAERTATLYKEKVMANSQRANCVTARVDMNLRALGKETAVGGRLRMKRDEAVQLSLSLLGFEVGRLEFTPEQVLIIDRVNRQYVRAAYADVDFLKQAELDFYTLQALFWNELFVPGQKSAAGHLSRFRYSDEGNAVLLTLEDAPRLSYVFQTQTAEGIINQVTVKGKTAGEKAKLEWAYDRFTRLDNRYFPTQMQFDVVGLPQQVGLTLSLSHVNNEDWTPDTKVSSRYRERQVEDILRQLMAL